MRIEVLCTGDELLTGLTADTNSPYFMGKLFALGEQVRCTTVVGDDREEILEALEALTLRADVVLVTGGLGPTADDLTVECAAKVAGVDLVEDAATRARLEARYAERGQAMSANNLKVALVPAGARVVANPVGSAPMLTLPINQAQVYLLPGVPREYRALVDAEVIPRIQVLLAVESDRVYRAARLFRTVGLPESQLDAKVAPVAQANPHVRFGFRTQAPENHLKLVAEGESQEQADARLAEADRQCREVLGFHVFGTGDESFAQVVGGLLAVRHDTIALAESCTGGLLAELFTRVPGASRYFLGSAVSYANGMKERWLEVNSESLRVSGAVSEQVAREMAVGARASARSTWALSITGIAGPDGGTPEKPVGTVFVGIAGPDKVDVVRHRFLGDREQIRWASAYAALDLLRHSLIGGHRS